MLLHSNVITKIQIVSKVLSRDLLNTIFKFLVPLSIFYGKVEFGNLGFSMGKSENSEFLETIAASDDVDAELSL